MTTANIIKILSTGTMALAAALSATQYAWAQDQGAQPPVYNSKQENTHQYRMEVSRIANTLPCNAQQKVFRTYKISFARLYELAGEL